MLVEPIVDFWCITFLAHFIRFVIHQEHFPPLVEPAGVWISFLDEFGKEWSFEFCFWHSKDSRIYYLKKFFPFVQSANIRGGDTGVFLHCSSEIPFCFSCCYLLVSKNQKLYLHSSSEWNSILLL